MNRKELKAAAKSQIKGKIGVLFLITVIISVISGVASGLLALIPGGAIVASVIITPAFALSMVRIYMGVVAGTKPTVKDSFSGFDDFWAAFKVTFLVELKVFLWSLLFVIPGIVKTFSYSMAMYVLAENKGMSARKCIEESKKMTKGHKMELFVLALSFIGWGLLVVVTFGIAAIWVAPYMQATFTNAYYSLKPVIEVEAEEVVEETAEAEA
ncbi:MAG: DUF975 family protein [Clostridia bacterium]|nr:DUF975 family protein [Clostridia bacterium]